MFIDQLYYCETSPTGLRWIRNGKHAGSKCYNDKAKTKPKCIDVRYNGKLHKAHRVICILQGEILLDEEVVNHIDNNPFNNKVDNLEIVSQTLNMRRCKSHTGNSLQVDNSTGVNGVSLCIRNGSVLGYNCSYRDSEGKIIMYNFSIAKYGKELALHLAAECRKFSIEHRNTEGAGYAILHK